MNPLAPFLRDAEDRLKAQGVSASLSIQGKCVEYKLHHYRAPRKITGRGEIASFTDAARLRMLKEFARVNYDATCPPLFVTLTYPDPLATPALEQRNIHRAVMARYMEKYLGHHVAAAWRVEWVPRKSGELIGQPCPHWHWLIFGVGFIPYAEINAMWKKTIAWEGYVRTDIRRVDERGVVQSYMAKYISKDAVSPSLVIPAYHNKLGRAYGWLRKQEIPWHDKIRHNALTDSQRAILTALAHELLPKTASGLETSFTLMGDRAEEAWGILDELGLTDAVDR
jgi:hypothetical protein